jgi:hypothetical protein
LVVPGGVEGQVAQQIPVGGQDADVEVADQDRDVRGSRTLHTPLTRGDQIGPQSDMIAPCRCGCCT